jgi:PAS domain S-box-containing protein
MKNPPAPQPPPSTPNPFGATMRIEICPQPFQETKSRNGTLDKLKLESQNQPLPLDPEPTEVPTPLGGVHFHHLLQNIYDAVFVTERTGKILLANLRAEQFFAALPGDLSHYNIVALLSGADPALLPTILNSVEANRFVLMQAYCMRLNGTCFPAEISVNHLGLAGKDCLSFFVRDTTERKRTEEALQQITLELQDKNAELGRFLYSASHDLKSPLVTVKTFLGYLKKDLETSDSAQIEKDMNFIGVAADKMARLLEELLDMSRIGRTASTPVEVPFRTLVEEAISAVAGCIAKGGVRVMVEDYDMVLRGDRLRLAEIWQNLVDNACKFMGDQKEPRIEIGVETRGVEKLFFVRDNGVGIDPQYHSKIFGLFEQLNPQVGSTGIGLAHVKRIVEVYGGRIWVESAGIGRGATFLFNLPGAATDRNDIKH